jgi:hypothetical protein
MTLKSRHNYLSDLREQQAKAIKKASLKLAKAKRKEEKRTLK